jgi:hypothetical protein
MHRKPPRQLDDLSAVRADRTVVERRSRGWRAKNGPDQYSWLAIAALLLVGLVASCRPNPETPQAARRTTGPPRGFGRPYDSELSAAVRPPRAWQETWDIHLLGGQPVGFTQTISVPAGDASSRLLRTSSLDQLTIRRGAEQLVQRLEQSCWETPEGKLIGATNQIGAGDERMVIDWRNAPDGWRVTTSRPGRPDVSEQSVAPGLAGPFAVQQSLRREPMQPGDTRTIEQIVPMQTRPAQTRLEARQLTTVELLDEQRNELLEVDCRLEIPGQPAMPSRIWVDRAGEIIKSHQAAMELTSIRTTRERVLELTRQSPSVDLLAFTKIDVDRTIDRQAEVLFVDLETVDERPLDGAIPKLPWQSIRRIDDSHYRLTILRHGPAGGQPPTPYDLQAGSLIESDDPLVRQLAARVNEQSPTIEALAIGLAGVVHDHITQVDYSRAFSSAAAVARRGAGDCTEHAVLLAALCRARGIPARVAAGLVYIEPAGRPAFAWHLWTWAWMGDRWLPLDASMSDPRAGADRIHLVSSDLADGNEYACLGSALAARGRWKLRIADAGGDAAPETDDGRGVTARE